MLIILEKGEEKEEMVYEIAIFPQDILGPNGV